ncbi:MAG: hypothetical protein AABY22_17335, partial [Nanoarchaeota archaeon]
MPAVTARATLTPEQVLHTVPEETRLPLPKFADPELAHYRVQRVEIEEGGWDAVPVEIQTTLCHPEEARRVIYPAFGPGMRYSSMARAAELPARRSRLSADRQGGLGVAAPGRRGHHAPSTRLSMPQRA